MENPPPPSPLRYAWFVVALLVPVAMLNYLDRQMLATMKASMVGDIPTIANRADWGLVLGCFKWTYAVLSPFGGYVSDRFSRRYVIGGAQAHHNPACLRRLHHHRDIHLCQQPGQTRNSYLQALGGLGRIHDL